MQPSSTPTAERIRRTHRRSTAELTRRLAEGRRARQAAAAAKDAHLAVSVAYPSTPHGTEPGFTPTPSRALALSNA